MPQNEISKLIQEAQNLYEAGNLVDAALMYKSIVAQDPDNVEALYRWACIAMERGKFGNAEQLLKKVVGLDSVHRNALNTLGQIYLQGKRHEESRTFFSRALETNPNDLDVITNLAHVALDEYDFWQAEELCRKGLALDNNHAGLQMSMGYSLYGLKKSLAAIDSFKLALSIDPAFEEEALNSIGLVYLHMGDAEEAKKYFQKVLKKSPDDSGALYNFVRSHRFSKEDPMFAELEKSITHITARAEYAYFALAKAYHDIKDFDRAFHYYDLGNKTMRSAIEYSSAETERRFATIEQIFSPDIEACALAKTEAEFTPIFILGMPRSGTSLAEQMLAGHPDISAGGETMYIQQALKKYTPFKLLDGETISAISNETLFAMREDYLKKLRRHAPDAKYIIDKAPSNFQFVGLIRMLFPEAKVFHTVRSPEATCFSLYRTLFTEDVSYAYDQQELGTYYNAYKGLMKFWSEKLPSYMHDISYEELVKNPEREVTSMLAFCGLGFDQACLDFHKNKNAVMTASSLQVKKPLYKNANETWKKYRKHLRPLLDTLDT